MEYASAQIFNSVSHISPALPGRKFIVLGGPAPEISGLNLLNLEGALGFACDAVILLKHIDPPELANVLSEAPDPAVPIADFFGNHPVRRDFIGSLLNDESAKEMQHALTPILHRLKELPFRAEREDREPMTLLRLAYSRNAPAKAAFDPGYPLTVQYPLVGTGAGTREKLEFLAEQDLFRRRHFTRTHACGKCGSSRLHVYEACSECGGSDLADEVVIHHYRCGCQEPESHFIQGDLLVCPKCHRGLHHIGIDYGKPGKVVVCGSCGAVNSEPLVNFICLDCSTVTAADRASETDWYHYDLTEKGLATLREGRLPRFEPASPIGLGARAYTPREFRLLAVHEMRAARRFERPFTMARITFPNVDSIRRDLGLLATDVAVRHAIDAIVGTVRGSDFVGAGSNTSIIIGFPETAAESFRHIEDRIRKSIHDAVVVPLKLSFDIAEGDAIVDMLAKD
jgi:hypothetical protein